MTALNRAFIKAYQRSGIGGPHIPLTAAAPAVIGPADASPDADAPGDCLMSGPVELAAPCPEPAPPLESQDRLHPAFEVERFDWPATVGSLLESNPELTALMHDLLPTGQGTLVVSGCRRGEGRTSVALMLARHLAVGGLRVALVDADVQRPQIASRLGVAVEAGWEECLTGQLPAIEAAIESLTDHLTILPLRRPVPASVLNDKGDCLKALVDHWRAAFDVVLIDAAPLGEADEASHESLLGARVDAAVVVRDVRHCRLEQTHAVGRKLVQLGVCRWAIVENFCGDACTKPIGS
jgi:Mrp family chromosome partitioning ATPase